LPPLGRIQIGFQTADWPGLKAGKDARDHVEAMLGSFSIEITIVDGASARRAAAVRARTALKLTDAYALATAIHAEHNGHDDVRLVSFDKAVLRAHAELRPNRSPPRC